MIIAIDGMGGDNSPMAVVEGCVLALKEYDVKLIITGPEDKIKNELSKYIYDEKENYYRSGL